MKGLHDNPVKSLTWSKTKSNILYSADTGEKSYVKQWNSQIRKLINEKANQTPTFSLEISEFNEIFSGHFNSVKVFSE